MSTKQTIPENDAINEIATGVEAPTVGELGELALIERLRVLLPGGGDVVVGPGDDCAVVRPDPAAVEDWVLKSDPVIAGRHFDMAAEPRLIGHKAIGRVLSDLASMGAVPRWGLVDLVLTPEIPVTMLDDIYDGMVALAARHGLMIVGGDTSQGSELALHVFAVGSLPRGSARLRSGARPGDLIYVTGRLGGSLAGRHLCFEPRVTEGQWLRNWVNSMIDISDGLASELWHLAVAGGVAIEIDAAAVPLAAAAGERGIAAALDDGEDFELLFSLSPEKAEEFEVAWQRQFPTLECSRIGIVTNAVSGGQVSIRYEAGGSVRTLPRRGYEHLRGPGAGQGT